MRQVTRQLPFKKKPEAPTSQKNSAAKERLALLENVHNESARFKLTPYIMPTAEERVEALTKAQTTERVINEKERAELTKISRTTWYRLESKNLVPTCGTNGKKRFWMISDIYVYLYRKTGSGVLPHKG